MEWNGMEWYGMVWYGMEWYGMEWNDMTIKIYRLKMTLVCQKVTLCVKKRVCMSKSHSFVCQKISLCVKV